MASVKASARKRAKDGAASKGASTVRFEAEWNEELHLSGPALDGSSLLVFTLLRRRTASTKKRSHHHHRLAAPPSLLTRLAENRDEFLGQALLRLDDVPDQGRGGPGSAGGGFRLAGGSWRKELKLGALKVRVFDGKEHKLKLENKAFDGGPKLRVEFQRHDSSTVFSGWMWAHAGKKKESQHLSFCSYLRYSSTQ